MSGHICKYEVIFTNAESHSQMLSHIYKCGSHIQMRSHIYKCGIVAFINVGLSGGERREGRRGGEWREVEANSVEKCGR